MESRTSDKDLCSSLPKQIWYKDEYLYQLKGFWFRLHYLLGTQRVLNQHKPQSEDVILASFPKTGTTWVKSLLYSLLNRSPSGDSLSNKHPHELVPSLELQVYKSNVVSSSTSRSTITANLSRIFSTHIPYQLLDETINSSDCRVIYVTRNPKDTLVSLVHFIMKADKGSEKLSSKAAADMFCKGLVPFGPYYDHVLGYWSESLRVPDKLLFITYEELKENPKAQVKRLAEFLKCPFGVDDEEQKKADDIIKKCSFENLSNYEANKSDEIPNWIEVPYSSFFRQGKVGDYKNYLQENDIARIDAMTREKFHASGFMYGI